MAAPRRVSSAARTNARSRSSAQRRAAAKETPRPSPRRVPGFAIAPGTVRSLLGVGLLVMGTITLIGLALPNAGILNRYVSVILRPNFGQGAWLMAGLLIVAGALVERAPKVGNGWGVAAVGGLVLFLGGEGVLQLLWGGDRDGQLQLAQGGGRLGNLLSSGLSDLVSTPGAYVVLVGVCVAGILLLFNLTLRSLLRPVATGGRAVATAATTAAAATVAAARAPAESRASASAPASGSLRSGAAAAPPRGGRRPSPSRHPDPVQDGGADSDGEARNGSVLPELPSPVSSPAPISQTVWSAASLGPNSGRLNEASSVLPGSVPSLEGESESRRPRAWTTVPAPEGRGESATSDETSIPPVAAVTRPSVWSLPAVDLLDEEMEKAAAATLDHQRNVRIIEDKLRSFQIPATVVGTNTGPVVTQYEVRPDARVKLSRIEGLADDLAMALAARSIRIEAPIPGRDVVGIEIPNHSSEVVSFRALYEDAQMSAATSKLTFALGRDVSGKAYAVDLARMPHLLIAGATGSGKSVCVNALITSLLMRARPEEVRLVLVDLKRVELAQYDGLPHLLTSVIVEANEARSALGWAVHEMEQRYKALAARAERNITAYNSSVRVEPDERLPYIVLVIDELADLIMREGRKVEDPIVKVAQKARAVGIHLVLATQRPSVNVVTGLIKANVPSRIAFAMSSNVDSRTVLDAPGAEDLIGRGDMLYQPADLPRPVRLQGVFVSDAEVRAVTDAWRTQAPNPDYDPALLSGADDEGEGGGGQFGWLAQMAEDEMTARAAELVMQTGKASTSMMQTKLKVGFNRASRLMDELERYGIVGPQDPRNPAVPRHVYGAENWLRGAADADDL